jgi:hypothetical protein
MQHLNTLWKAVNAASVVTDLARTSHLHSFIVTTPITFYLQAEHTTVHITRWSEPKIEVNAQLQAAFGWRLAADQDEAGVYVVAKRRAVVGGLSSAIFHIALRHDTHLILRLTDGQVILEGVDGTLHIPPPERAG